MHTCSVINLSPQSGPRLYTATWNCFFKNKEPQPNHTNVRVGSRDVLANGGGGGLLGKDFAVCCMCSFSLAESHLKQILLAFISSEKKFLSQQNKPS